MGCMVFQPNKNHCFSLQQKISCSVPKRPHSHSHPSFVAYSQDFKSDVIEQASSPPCLATDYILYPLIQRKDSNKEMQMFCLSQHQNKKMPWPICTGPDTSVLPEFNQRRGTAGGGQEGCLFIYILSKPVFSRQESLPSLFTKFSLGIVRITARGLVLSIHPTTDVSFFLLPCAGPLVLLWGRQN